MTTRELIQWTLRGYADARDTLGRDLSDNAPLYPRAPKVPEEELYITPEQAAPDVAAYWSGFDGGILDNVSHVLRGVQ